MRDRSSLPSLEQLFLKTLAERLSASVPATAGGITTPAQLERYLVDTLGVRVPKVRVCENHVAPWDAFCRCFFARDPVIVIKGSRGLSGKTFLLGLLALSEAVLLGADVTVLAGSGAQSRRLHKAMTRFWAAPNAPRALLLGDPGVTKTVFRAGNEVEALTASQKSARSPHPQRLRLDEVDEMDPAILDAAMGQTLAARGIPAQTVLASTHQYPDGTFSEVLRRAAEKGWPVLQWCWRETVQPHGWLAPAEVDRKRHELTEQMFQTEVELHEPAAQGRAIDQDAVDAMFDPALGETEGEPGETETFESPDPHGSYASGADWGKSRDFSAISTLRTDLTPGRFVAFSRDRRKPLHLMAAELDHRLDQYGGAAAHDAWGIGAVMDETFRHHDIIPYTQWQGEARVDLFTHYIAAIEQGRLRAPRSAPWYRAHRYVTIDDLYGDGHPPDEFVSGALAYYAQTHPPLEIQRMKGAIW